MDGDTRRLKALVLLGNFGGIRFRIAASPAFTLKCSSPNLLGRVGVAFPVAGDSKQGWIVRVRVSFNQVFQVNADGSVTPRAPVQIGGIQMGPGVTFGRGVQFAGIDIAAIQGSDLEVTIQGVTYVITGYYPR